MKFFFIVFLSTLCYQCTNSPKNLEEFMVDVDQFKMKEGLLNDFDYVEILGLSGNLTEEHKIDFYNLVVVRSMETGDTINILVTNFYNGEMSGNTTRYISNTSLIGKIYERNDNSKEDENFHLDDLKAKKYKKVLYDKEFIQVDVFQYPTIIGTLGNWTVEGDVEAMEKLLNLRKDSIPGAN